MGTARSLEGIAWLMQAEGSEGRRLSAQIWNLFARNLLARGDLAAALRCYTLAAARGDRGAEVRLFHLYLRAERVTEALRWAKRSLRSRLPVRRTLRRSC